MNKLVTMLNHEFEGLSKTGRAREVPLTIFSNWIASRLFAVHLLTFFANGEYKLDSTRFYD